MSIKLQMGGASLARLLSQALQIFGFELGFELSNHYTTSFSQPPL
jgi:hypothetical protein